MTAIRNHNTRRAAALVASALALILITNDGSDPGVLVLGIDEAHAVVGRPLTPVSYAGVARRTTRRTVAATGAATTMPAGYVTTLPAGCATAGGIYTCGTARYRPYYNGPSLVYVPI
jgi:hypothetical protein